MYSAASGMVGGKLTGKVHEGISGMMEMFCLLLSGSYTLYATAKI